jgi:hypothetical protein
MSALGHKRTYAVQKGMSALPPKADMCAATGDVRFGPIADIVAHGRILRAAPVRMLPRVCAPAQAPKVEVLRVAEEVSQLHKEAVGHVPQPKCSDVLAPALRAAGTHGVFGVGLRRFKPRGWRFHVRHFAHNLSSVSSAELTSRASFEFGSMSSSLVISATYSGPSFVTKI